ncbi:hypothetical protein NUU61_009410 [Penicillium alfredii]|uniref:Uncharacterized protein n=1 Tax=Penicillium alfredii TaxID=1506179 RepID=A0A9W9EN32_9EURO|nr:uncharacterized protein NUU61_009410 [Penicillium alfredii]KAJ5084831.1 hypothetical protein NUU61_009410 [Penicillium alfredii]
MIGRWTGEAKRKREGITRNIQNIQNVDLHRAECGNAVESSQNAKMLRSEVDAPAFGPLSAIPNVTPFNAATAP